MRSLLHGRARSPGSGEFGRRSSVAQVTSGLDLRGRTIAITGANSGIGLELARAFSARGARVLALCRSLERARSVADAHPGVAPIACDLEDPSSVRAAADALGRTEAPLHAIVANAGIMMPPKLERVHGYERQFFTNHVAHHLLVTRLLPALAPDGRVVVLSSSLHTAAPREGIDLDNLDGHRGYDPWTAYGRSKLANILFAKALARRLPRPDQTSNAVHPGVASTGLQRRLRPGARLLFALGAAASKSVAQAAATPAFVAVHPAAAPHNGEYFADCAPVRLAGHAVDAQLAERLWTTTEDILRTLQER